MATVRVSEVQNINLNQLFFAMAGMMLIIGITMAVIVNMLVGAKVEALTSGARTYQANPVTVSAPNQTNEAPAAGVCAVPSAASDVTGLTSFGDAITATGYSYGSVFGVSPLGSYTYSPSNSSTITTTTTDSYTYYDDSFNTTRSVEMRNNGNTYTDNRNSHNGGNTHTDNRNSNNGGNTDTRIVVKDNGNDYSRTTTTSNTTNTVTVRDNGNTTNNSTTTTNSHNDNSNQGNTTDSNNGGNTTTNNINNGVIGDYNGIANGNRLDLL